MKTARLEVTHTHPQTGERSTGWFTRQFKDFPNLLGVLVEDREVVVHRDNVVSSRIVLEAAS